MTSSPVRRRLATLLPAALLLLLLIPAVSQAQATRTWVSGVGDDANPCSRTAPCKTFAGAISKTAARGEINALDPGGYGAVTITKSITIDAENTVGGVLNAGTNGVVVNAAPTDRVVLRGLDINGAGSGVNGVRVIQAKSVMIDDSKIYNQTANGVLFQASASKARLTVKDTRITDNAGNGIFASPTGAGPARVTLRRNEIEGNACGVVAATFGLTSPVDYSVNCGAATSGAMGRATITAFRNGVSENDGAGFLSIGSLSTIRIGSNEISGNGIGLSPTLSGTIASFGDNSNTGNVTDGAPNATVAKQ